MALKKNKCPFHLGLHICCATTHLMFNAAINFLNRICALDHNNIAPDASYSRQRNSFFMQWIINFSMQQILNYNVHLFLNSDSIAINFYFKILDHWGLNAKQVCPDLIINVLIDLHDFTECKPLFIFSFVVDLALA